MEVNDAVVALGAISQPSRLNAFRLLVRHEPHGLPAGELARALAIPQNTLSSHLSILRRAGLVSQNREGRRIIYRADLETMGSLVAYLLEDCCDGEICLPETLTGGRLCD